MPLEVKQIDPINAPDKFFLPRDTGEVDEDLNPIIAYDLANEDLDPIPVEFPNAIKVLKKKAFDGHVYLAVMANRTDIWWQKDEDASPILVAQA